MSKNCQKLEKISKKFPKFSFFQKIANGNFFEKNENFMQFFKKFFQVFGNFLTFKWQFSGGPGHDLCQDRSSGKVFIPDDAPVSHHRNTE